jgi:hypothetical protein
MTDLIEDRLHRAATDVVHRLDAAPPNLDSLLRRRRASRAMSIGVVAVVIIGAALVAITARPRGDGRPAGSPPAAQSSWLRQTVPLAPTLPVPIASDREQSVAVTLDSAGVMTSFVIGANGRTRMGRPLATGRPSLGMSGSRLVHTRSGWLGILQGSEGPHETTDDVAVVVKSADGLRWSATKAIGLSGATIADVVATNGRIVAVGATVSRSRDSQITALPRAWWSDDGVHWHMVELPVPAGQHGSAVGVVWAGDGLWAVGKTDAGVALWVSDIDGMRWSSRPKWAVLPRLTSVKDMTVVAGSNAVSLVGTPTDGAGDHVYWSDDLFRTWHSPSGLTSTSSTAKTLLGPLGVSDNRLYTYRVDNVPPEGSRDPCAEWKTTGCPIGVHRFFVTSRAWPSGNPVTWLQLDTSGAPGSEDADTIAVSGNNRVSLVRFRTHTITVWTWVGRGEVPTLPR